MKTISKIAALCSVILLALTSCDNTASDLEVDPVTGTYTGKMDISLYVPDGQIESSNNSWNVSDTLIDYALCTHVNRNTVMDIEFQGADAVAFRVDSLKNLTFRLNFLDYYYAVPEYDASIKGPQLRVEIRSEYSDGLFATMVNAVNNAYIDGINNGNSVITNAEYEQFLQMMQILTDTMTLSAVQTSALNMEEAGVVLVSYDDEQNSYYHQFTTNEFKYTRKSNMKEILVYAKTVLLPKVNAVSPTDGKDLAQAISYIVSMMQESGTVSDGWGWATFAYANYRPYIDIHMERATGLLDALSVGLFGPERNNSYEPVVDASTGRLTPLKELWLVLKYNGSFSDYIGEDWKKVE